MMTGDHRFLSTQSYNNRAGNHINNSPRQYQRQTLDQSFGDILSPRLHSLDPSPEVSPVASALSLPLYDYTGQSCGFDIKTEDISLPILPGYNQTMQQQHQWSPQPSNLAPARPIGQSAAFAHNRDSSISSLGSVGPVSPFSQSSTNPQIVLNEGLSNGALDMSNFYDEQSFPMAKQASSSTNGSFYGQAVPFATADLPMHSNANTYGSLMAMPQNPTHSQPVSATSSIASNSPATPLLDCADDDSRRRNGMIQLDPPLFDACEEDGLESSFMQDLKWEISAKADMERSHIMNTGLPGVPNKAADRSVSDLFGEDIYRPAGLAMPTSAPMRQHMGQAVNQQFAASLQNSPAHAGPSQDYTQSPRNNQLRFGSAPLLSERSAGQPAPSTPHTISPRDAVLEYREQDGEAGVANYSLFPQQHDQQARFAAANAANAASQMSQRFSAMPGAVTTSSPVVYNSYLAPQMPPNMQQHLQNNLYVAQQQQQQPVSQPVPQTVPAQSMNTGRSVMPTPRTVASLDMLSQPVPGSQRPGIDTSDGGTYTCTYHGCSQRFETPSALQKHKREGHRQMHAITTACRPSTSSIGAVNTQAGPHKCERINPSTGKPCNTIFSRPYDLTRHEDTIHNARKQKVRCKLCMDEKTFSRADALTRHFRVCHPEVDFQGKHKRRGRGSNIN